MTGHAQNESNGIKTWHQPVPPVFPQHQQRLHITRAFIVCNVVVILLSLPLLCTRPFDDMLLIAVAGIAALMNIICTAVYMCIRVFGHAAVLRAALTLVGIALALQILVLLSRLFATPNKAADATPQPATNTSFNSRCNRPPPA